MRINTNVASLNAQEAATNTNMALRSSLEKLSTGLAINKASDDASGMAIADKLRTQASSVGQAIKNGNSAAALLQIADKAMAEQSNILDIVKTKLLQASTETTSAEGRDAIAKDISKLLQQLNNIASQTNYNGNQVLQHSVGTSAGAQASAGKLIFQMGEFAINIVVTASGVQANVKGLGLETLSAAVTAGKASGIQGAGSASNARALLVKIDTALDKMNSWRADFGSSQNQIESSVRNLSTIKTNLKAAESVIRDVDYANESANFNKQNIIAQAGTYALSQANQVQQTVLRLLE